MLISHTHNFIYLKTFKTASTSVEAFFSKWCLPPDYKVEHSQRESITEYGVVSARHLGAGAGDSYQSHMPAIQVKQRFPAEFDSYFKFCCVRNPWDRLVSRFWHDDFKWVRSRNKSWKEAQKLFELYLDKTDHFKDNTTIYSIDGEFVVDDVIRYEDLEAEIYRVCSILGLDTGALPRYKCDMRPADHHYSEYYTPKTVELVRQKCQFEIEKFGYKFEYLE